MSAWFAVVYRSTKNVKLELLEEEYFLLILLNSVHSSAYDYMDNMITGIFISLWSHIYNLRFIPSSY